MSRKSDSEPNLAPETAKVAKGEPALTDLMLAMDIVDTLRHDMRIAERELNDASRREDLKARLKQLYKSQGIDVPDSILEDGVRALEQDRFTYKPKELGFAGQLARLYVDRDVWLKRVGVALLIVIGAGAAWYMGIERPRQQQEVALQAALERDRDTIEALASEITGLSDNPQLRAEAATMHKDGLAAVSNGDSEAARRAVEALRSLRDRLQALAGLPARLQQLEAAIRAETKEQEVLAAVDRQLATARQAIQSGELDQALSETGKLQQLLDVLQQSYTIRIVQGQGEQSGVFRVPDVNQATRNYYLIVEAVTADGQKLELPVTSEETRQTSKVRKWGIRVPESVYNAVRDDKIDDGIVQNDTVAQKRRGALRPDWQIAVDGGAITQW